MNRGGLLREEASSGVGQWPRACDSCRSAQCAVYCRADAAYLCAGCDARVHAANRVASRHERVWVCEACERAPAALTCRADAASLCAACDADVHSANPLARRHQRVPILPIPPGRLPGRGRARVRLDGVTVLNTDGEEKENDDDEEEDEAAASWLLLNPVKNSSNQGGNTGFLFGGEVDEYLDLGEYTSGTDNQNPEQHNLSSKYEGTERLVPIEFLVPNEHQNQQEQQQQQQQQVLPVEMEYEVSNAGFSYTPISHSVSVSSMEAGVVPDNTTMTDISNSHIRPSKGTIDLFSGPPLQMPTQFTPKDREARVHRYREKRKMRKFEKTIRYASRKAYAETRPRIKGRFAKRSDVELEVDQMFATSVISEGSYGIVPSF